ncbi:hypothetical protein HMPREF1568_3907 [Providencia alcalifaciens PAL-3]|nr:hypothetical protein HMPREF1568_3907 [Providencia alcalifaciens PAL-3]
MKTTHIVYRLNNVRVSQKSQLECVQLTVGSVGKDTFGL